MNQKTSAFSGKGKKAVLFKSSERFEAFRTKLDHYGVDCTVLDFDQNDWVDFDYSQVDFAIYYPSFENSSGYPLALYKVYDNIAFLHSEYPDLQIYPDPGIIKYYNDKYRQYLFLKKNHFPIPDTLPLHSIDDVNAAEESFGYPMILKNRYGAGGGSVFKIENRKDLDKYFCLSQMHLFNVQALKHFGSMMASRLFWYHTIKAKRVPYPFLSPPLLAQRFVKIDRDLKTVVGGNRVVEGHWRLQANNAMWKMNIDGGGTGVWSEIPQDALELSLRLGKVLKASWLNIDLIHSGEQFLITEFSPVWHHYLYKEKPSFVYSDDYNLDPLEYALDLERIIVESLLQT
ncbi:MAG: ATP-grasp domain-containing protein [Desulfuromonadales bacterium]|nr:ATP-grasp domain-containing protein [Desulfuromonadales bacterium]